MSTAAQRDLRDTSLYKEAEALYRSVRKPGTDQISDAIEIHVSPDGRWAAFAGVAVDKLEGFPQTRIFATELTTGTTKLVTFGPNVDRSPKFSPDGQLIAFLSDRHANGDFQLYLLDLATGEARASARVEGWVEYLHWSPDGQHILLGVAAHGADTSSSEGALMTQCSGRDLPAWLPAVQSRDQAHQGRSAWIYDLAVDGAHQVPAAPLNIWEAAWCSNESLAAIVSDGPSEGHWYGSRLQLINIRTGKGENLYVPTYQIGWPASCPTGRHVAVVEALCSDRWVMAGDLRIVGTSDGSIRFVATHGVDVTCCEWRSEHTLLIAGHRGFEMVIARFDLRSGLLQEIWSTRELSTSARYATVSGLGEAGDCALIGEGLLRAREIAVKRAGQYHVVKSFDVGYCEQAKVIDAVDQITWRASDGLEIEGWLLRPKHHGPLPLIMGIHGGPVFHSRPIWLCRWNVVVLMLIKHGYALFLPNPRGSSGRGHDFVRCIQGDLGGADARDLLSGVDFLIEQGIADRLRIGVMGGSYGGFLVSWLITQDMRFAAAVSIVPHTNHLTQRLLSNIPVYMDLFLLDQYHDPKGRFFERSPIMHAHKVKTPTLAICGALDRSTPAEEAMQFHNVLVENGVESVLVTYPQEGHGVRGVPASIDYAARIVSWFEDHVNAGPIPSVTVGAGIS